MIIRPCIFGGKLLNGQVEATDRTCVVLIEPRLQTIRVVNVTAWHEHTLCFYFDVIAADRAAGSFEFASLPLTVFLFDVYDWQFFNGRPLGPLLFLSLLSLLLANSSDHFKEFVRGKV